MSVHAAYEKLLLEQAPTLELELHANEVDGGLEMCLASAAGRKYEKGFIPYSLSSPISYGEKKLSRPMVRLFLKRMFETVRSLEERGRFVHLDAPFLDGLKQNGAQLLRGHEYITKLKQGCLESVERYVNNAVSHRSRFG